MNFTQIFFPSWRFFDHIEMVPVLQHRERQGEQSFGDWQNTLPPHRRSWKHLLVNPQGGLRYAYLSLVDRLIQKCQSEPNSEQLASSIDYLLVERTVRSLIPQDCASQFQFRIIARATKEPFAQSEILLSQVHEVNPP